MRQLKKLDSDIGHLIKKLREIYQKLNNVDSLPEVIYNIAKLVSKADGIIGCGRGYRDVKWLNVDEMKEADGLTDDDVKLVEHVLATLINILEVEKQSLENSANIHFLSAEGRYEDYLMRQNLRNICYIVDELAKLAMWLHVELLRQAEYRRVGEYRVDKAISIANVLSRRYYHDVVF